VDGAAAALLATLPQWAFAAALLIARIGSACMLLPLVGETELPATIRAGFTLALVALLAPSLAPLLPAQPASPLAAAALVIGEIAIGLWLGWLARLPMLALPMAGQFIAGLTGMANVLEPDPAQTGQNTALGKMFALAAPVALLQSGLYVVPLAALAASYTALPPGAALAGADIAQASLHAVSASFALALRLAAPFLVASILWQAAVGLLARLVPRLQVYFVALPGQILGGLVLLALLATYGRGVDAGRRRLLVGLRRRG
jgi:flagellar biosynthetic protein FliR